MTYLNLQSEINGLRAINSQVIQQACIQEAKKFADCDMTISKLWSNCRLEITLKGPLNFWSLPADCLSCNTDNLIFNKSFSFVCPDYDTTIHCTVSYSEPLPPEMLATLYMLGKIEVTSSSHMFRSVVCKI